MTHRNGKNPVCRWHKNAQNTIDLRREPGEGWPVPHGLVLPAAQS